MIDTEKSSALIDFHSIPYNLFDSTYTGKNIF